MKTIVLSISGEISAPLRHPGARGTGAVALAVWLMMGTASAILAAILVGSTVAPELLVVVVGIVAASVVLAAEEAGAAVGSVDFVAVSVAVKAK